MLTNKARAFLMLHCPDVDPSSLSGTELTAIEKAIKAADMQDARAIQKAVAAVEHAAADDDTTTVNKSLLRKTIDRFTTGLSEALLGKAVDDEDEDEYPEDDDDEIDEEELEEELEDEEAPVDTSDLDLDIDYYEGDENDADEADLELEGEEGADELSDEEIDAALDTADRQMTEEFEDEEDEEDEDEDEDEEFLGKSILGGDEDVVFVDGDALMDEIALIVGDGVNKSLKPLQQRVAELEDGQESVQKSLDAIGHQAAEASPYAVLQHKFDRDEGSNVDRADVTDVTHEALHKSLADLTPAEAATIQKAAGTSDFQQHEDRFKEVLEAVNRADDASK